MCSSKMLEKCAESRGRNYTETAYIHTHTHRDTQMYYVSNNRADREQFRASSTYVHHENVVDEIFEDSRVNLLALPKNSSVLRRRCDKVMKRDGDSSGN